MNLRLFVKVEAIIADLLQFGEHALIINAPASQRQMITGSFLHGQVTLWASPVRLPGQHIQHVTAGGGRPQALPV